MFDINNEIVYINKDVRGQFGYLYIYVKRFSTFTLPEGRLSSDLQEINVLKFC